LDTEAWQFASAKAHFGLYNKSGIDQQYSFFVKEVKEEDLLPEDIRTKS